MLIAIKDWADCFSKVKAKSFYSDESSFWISLISPPTFSYSVLGDKSYSKLSLLDYCYCSALKEMLPMLPKLMLGCFPYVALFFSSANDKS